MIAGVVLSLTAACLWAFSPLCFAGVGRRIGSYPLTVLRSAAASVILLAVLGVHLAVVPAARVLPGGPQFFWVAVSALCGMVLGDLLLFHSYVKIGPRRATQVLMLAPVFTVLAAWAGAGETLPPRVLAGIAVVLGATAFSVCIENEPGGREPGRVSVTGFLVCLTGALFIGLGAAAMRQAYRSGPLDPLLATTLRVLVSAVVLGILPVLRGAAGTFIRKLRDREVLVRFIPGVLAGPVLAMLCYVTAFRQLEAGVVSTLSAASPLFILPMVWVRYRSRIGGRALLATALGFAGVALICWR